MLSKELNELISQQKKLTQAIQSLANETAKQSELLTAIVQTLAEEELLDADSAQDSLAPQILS